LHLTAIFIPLTSNVLTEFKKCTILFVTKGKGTDMKVEVKISDDVLETYAVIYTNRMSEEVNKIVEQFNTGRDIVTALKDEKIVVLRPEEICMIRMESEKVVIYGKNSTYKSGKRLYELEEQLGSDFMRISKSVIINLKFLDSMEPSFNGMLVVLKNGCKDYVSRKYLPDLKKYLGI
jgi:two-component system response regulator LytT